MDLLPLPPRQRVQIHVVGKQPGRRGSNRSIQRRFAAAGAGMPRAGPVSRWPATDASNGAERSNEQDREREMQSYRGVGENRRSHIGGVTRSAASSRHTAGIPRCHGPPGAIIRGCGEAIGGHEHAGGLRATNRLGRRLGGNLRLPLMRFPHRMVISAGVLVRYEVRIVNKCSILRMGMMKATSQRGMGQRKCYQVVGKNAFRHPRSSDWQSFLRRLVEVYVQASPSVEPNPYHPGPPQLQRSDKVGLSTHLVLAFYPFRSGSASRIGMEMAWLLWVH